jgi:hypothetical protein
MELKLTILKVTGGSAGQMIKLGLISPEPEILAARIVKEKDSSFIEFFTKTTDHGLVEGDAFTLTLDPDDLDSTPASLVPTPIAPQAQMNAAQQMSPPTPPVQPPFDPAIQAAEQKLADDALELEALKRAEAAGHAVPYPPTPVNPSATQPLRPVTPATETASA